MLGIGCDRQHGLGRGFEQQGGRDDRLVLVGDIGDRTRQCEHDVKVADGQQLRLTLGEPFLGGSALALGAVPVAAAIVDDDHVGALVVLAARHMAAERRRAAVLDRTHDLHLAEAHMAGIGFAPRRPVVAEDIRDLQRWTGHGAVTPSAGLSCSSLWLSWASCGAATEGRAGFFDAGDHAGSDARIARCGVQFVVTQERLDDFDIGAALQQVGREAVAQRVQRHALLDPGFIGRLVETVGSSWRSSGGPALAARKQPASSKGSR